MIHLSTTTPERFSALAEDPGQDHERLMKHIDLGKVDPEHLLIATDASGDVGRVGLYRAGDGTLLTHAWRVRTATEAVYRVLATGVTGLIRRRRLAPVYTVVIDADEPDPAAKRSALDAAGWQIDDDRLELIMTARRSSWGAGIETVSPQQDRVLSVLAAAMTDSADTYDLGQVRALGADRAARAYRDMMTDGDPDSFWLAHHGPAGIDGIAAIQRYPTDWCLGYLGVAPTARRQGVGRALAAAMVSATAQAGIGQVTASVAVGNAPIRATLDGVGFSTRSARTDFILRP